MKTLFTFLAILLFQFKGMSQCPDINTAFTDSVSGATAYFFDQSSTTNGWLIQERYWEFGDSTVDSTVLNPIHTYSHSGHYIVHLTIKGQLPQDSATALYCEEITYQELTTLVADITDENDNRNLVIYPNPSNGYIRIKTSHSRIMQIFIYNMSGQLLSQTGNVDSYIELPDNTNLDSYFVRIETDKGDIVRRILMSR